MLIAEQDAVALCRRVMQHADLLAGSRSRFLQSFTAGVAELHTRIVNDFFVETNFAGKRILDVGPGLYPFSILARELGAEVVAIEFDEALAAAGRALGFEVHTDNLDWLPDGEFTGFDGVFLKGPFNACRQNVETIREATRRIDAVLQADGWGWVVNSNGPGRDLKARRRLNFHRFEGRVSTNSNSFAYRFGSFVTEIKFQRVLRMVDAKRLQEQLTELQRAAFEELGWSAELPLDEEARDYALTYQSRPYLFTKNLRRLQDLRGPRLADIGFRAYAAS